ncbi:MAG: hypothetical protein FD188_3427 [Ignavibacteria bacterium]|nr:MAG: hypothetical protein FD188_3427 [Ignavibacteria bacterium]
MRVVIIISMMSREVRRLLNSLMRLVIDRMKMFFRVKVVIEERELMRVRLRTESKTSRARSSGSTFMLMRGREVPDNFTGASALGFIWVESCSEALELRESHRRRRCRRTLEGTTFART